MRSKHLIARGLAYYWRTHLAVVAGVATAVAVLSGALLVGDSVRGSLRDLVLGRLGKTDVAVVSTGFLREALADEIQRDPIFAARFSGLAPLIVARGLVAEQAGGRRAGEVAVYGVDDRFWQFHGVSVAGPRDRDAFVSPALAAQIDAKASSVILVRVQRPTDVPLESLHGKKDDIGQTLRLTVSQVLPAASLSEFSLEATQGDVRAVFVPLSRLQQELESAGRVNMLLVSAKGEAQGSSEAMEQLVRAHTALDDLGLTLKVANSGRTIIVGSSAGFIGTREAAAAREAATASNMAAQPLLTYLANAMRVGAREVPYSLVTALDLRAVLGNAPLNLTSDSSDPRDPIVLTTWPARELQSRVGDVLSMEYYVWEDPGRLVTRRAEFRVAAVVPLEVGDRDFAPTFAGISDSPTLSDWDPPFPVDLRRIRPVDEQYWAMHRTTPKAYVPLEVGQRLWRSRYGELTSIRLTPPAGMSLDAARREYAGRLRTAIDPLASGMAVRDVREASLSASGGATDFGEYFVYFSFFLVVSALLLASLFFKLGVEQRIREVGLLRAVGFKPAGVQRLFLAEGALLAVIGSILGVLGALGYAALLMWGLRTWWVDAVGTTSLTLHVSSRSLAAGAVGGILSALVCIWWTLRSLGRITERTLLAGDMGDATAAGERRGHVVLVAAVVLAVLGVLLVVSGATGVIDPAGAFFGAGFTLLTASLAACLVLFRRRTRRPIDSPSRALPRLGFRNATYRPGRSVLSMAVIAAATFILISVDAFRRDAHITDTDRHSGVGGYTAIVNTLLPIARDPNTAEGREALNLFDLDPSVRFEPFRVRPGDDASCLNLYEPANPRIVAPRDTFLEEGRFVFADSLATTPEERANPWLLLERPLTDGAVPVIADANSMTYVLHRALGDEIVVPHGAGTLRLKLVGALRDSIFQGELLMSQADFLRLFPEQEGYQLLLVEAPATRAANLHGQIESGLSDLGADVVATADRLAEFHRVENTYLSTFQTLGGLGLLLGTVGLATVLLRNVLERRRELALLGAVGFRRAHVAAMILAENALLLAGGLAAGSLCAAIAIAPAIAERGGQGPLSARGLLLLVAVLVTGLLSSVVALRAATRAPLLSSLRSE